MIRLHEPRTLSNCITNWEFVVIVGNAGFMFIVSALNMIVLVVGKIGRVAFFVLKVVAAVFMGCDYGCCKS